MHTCRHAAAHEGWMILWTSKACLRSKLTRGQKSLWPQGTESVSAFCLAFWSEALPNELSCPPNGTGITSVMHTHTETNWGVEKMNGSPESRQDLCAPALPGLKGCQKVTVNTSWLTLLHQGPCVGRAKSPLTAVIF